MREIVFEILAEGGGLIIERERNQNNEKFIYNHAEMDLTDEGSGINRSNIFETFEQAFHLINSKYDWFMFHLETVHIDYKIYVLNELIKTLNNKKISPAEIEYSQYNLEKVLNAKLIFDYLPSKNEVQEITVNTLTELTEYEYQEYTDEYAKIIGQKFKLIGKFKTWTDEKMYFSDEMGIRNSQSFEVNGILEINGNTIIIKNEFGQIQYAFPSDKFFVSAKPILNKEKEWFYKN